MEKCNQHFTFEKYRDSVQYVLYKGRQINE